MLPSSKFSGSGITIHLFALRETPIHFALRLLYITLCSDTALLLPAALQLPGRGSRPGRAVCPGPAAPESCISVMLCTRLFLTFTSEDEQSSGDVCPLAEIPWKTEKCPSTKALSVFVVPAAPKDCGSKRRIGAPKLLT